MAGLALFCRSLNRRSLRENSLQSMERVRRFAVCWQYLIKVAVTDALKLWRHVSHVRKCFGNGEKRKMPTPKPLTPAQKRIFQVFLVIGIFVLGIGLYLSSSDDSGSIIVGAALGGGASMIAVSLMQLFYRPDR
jgi:hypothetical protein